MVKFVSLFILCLSVVHAGSLKPGQLQHARITTTRRTSSLATSRAQWSCDSERASPDQLLACLSTQTVHITFVPVYAPVTVRFFIVRRSTVNFNLNCCPCVCRQRSKQALERGCDANEDHDSDTIKTSGSLPCPLRCHCLPRILISTKE